KGYQQYGSDVAAPVFKEIADKIYARDLEMHSPFPEEFIADNSSLPVIKAGYVDDLSFLCDKLGISQDQKSREDWVKAKRSDTTVVWVDNPVKSGYVPDVMGMSLKDALYLLENSGLRVQVSGQ